MDNVNEAVKTIKEYCAGFKDCEDGCRFYVNRVGCMLSDSPMPEEWEVSD